MANIIDETENILILTVLVALIAFGVWLYLKFKAKPTNPENPDFGLNERNIKGWFDYLFPGLFPEVEKPDPDWSDSDYALVDDYKPNTDALQQAVQNAGSDFTQWFQGAEDNPSQLSVGSSPLF